MYLNYSRLFIIIIGLLLLTACEPPSNTVQTTITNGTLVTYHTEYTQPQNGILITTDSFYDTKIDGTVKYNYYYTRSDGDLSSSAFGTWTWSDTTISTDSILSYQQNVRWTAQKTPRSKSEIAAEYNVTIFSPKPLTYGYTAPFFQKVFQQLDQQLPFPIQELAPIATSTADWPIRLVLHAQRSSVPGYDKIYRAPDFEPAPVVWVPQDSLLLRLDITARTSQTDEVPAILVVEEIIPVQ